MATAGELAMDREEEHEQQLVREFFDGVSGFFVEGGANHPRSGSQSLHLEQRGWSGLLVGPLPELAEKLRQMRSAQVFYAPGSSPTKSGHRPPFYVADK